MSDLLNTIFDGRRKLNGIGFQLRSLAGAFRRTGNHEVAEELYEYASAMEEVGEEVVDAFGRDQQEELKRLEESSKNMVISMLEMVKEGKCQR